MLMYFFHAIGIHNVFLTNNGATKFTYSYMGDYSDVF